MTNADKLSLIDSLVNAADKYEFAIYKLTSNVRDALETGNIEWYLDDVVERIHEVKETYLRLAQWATDFHFGMAYRRSYIRD